MIFRRRRASTPIPGRCPNEGEGGARLILRALYAVLVLSALVVLLDLALSPDLGRLQRSSPVVLDHAGAWLRALPVEDGRWRIRADLDRTDPVFVQRLLAMEDRRFYAHAGVDLAAIARAAAGDLASGRVRSGGSTLTMQLARRLEPRRRTLLAKAIEALRARQLEARFTKRELLADYLTLAPYGGSLEGVRAASLAWFGHEPTQLTDAEQALLIALPQAPEGRRPDRHPEAARRARARVLQRLQRARLLTAVAVAEADAESLPRRQPFPALAWQVAGELARKAPPAQPTVLSTLEAPLQARLEALATRTATEQGPATSVAVMVVDVKTRAVRAAVASAGRDRPGGWVDATRAVRSPGSALKPFIYAMAFEAGLAAPETRLTDAPTRFAGYLPENFDRTFHDQVTAREALANSLNVPAVGLLQKLGAAGFEARLRAAGAEMVRPRSRLADPGLALALGGEGVRLRDVAMLYAALADGGVAKPLAFTLAEAAKRPAERGVRLVRADAAEAVLDILRESPPPPGRLPPALGAGAPKLAFKTGTSYGYRDALAIGVGSGVVVAVWTGRPDGGARPGLTGREAALPLLFEVFDGLSGQGGMARPIPPRQAPAALRRPEGEGEGPRLVFPPDGARVVVDGFGAKARGLVLAAEGDGVHWYADGAPLVATASGQVIWRPDAAGFYTLVAVDAQGRRVRARVRVVGG